MAGTQVRVVGMTLAPYQAKIDEILEDEASLSNGLSVPAVKVVDSDGKERLAPVANLEIDG